MFKFYILYSERLGRYYIGHSGDELEERVRRHNSKHSGYTGRTDDWRVVYFEQYTQKSQAYSREREVKSWKSKVRIRLLIEKDLAGSEHPA